MAPRNPCDGRRSPSDPRVENHPRQSFAPAGHPPAAMGNPFSWMTSSLTGPLQAEEMQKTRGAEIAESLTGEVDREGTRGRRAPTHRLLSGESELLRPLARLADASGLLICVSRASRFVF